MVIIGKKQQQQQLYIVTQLWDDDDSDVSFLQSCCIVYRVEDSYCWALVTPHHRP